MIKGSFGWEESYMSAPVLETVFCIMYNVCYLWNDQKSPLEYALASRLLSDCAM